MTNNDVIKHIITSHCLPILLEKPKVNEVFTKRKLIEPLLQSIGWICNGPVREVDTAFGPIDYLLSNKSISLTVEAKALGVRLTKLDEGKLLNKTKELGAQRAIFTNGDTWHIFANDFNDGFSRIESFNIGNFADNQDRIIKALFGIANSGNMRQDEWLFARADSDIAVFELKNFTEYFFNEIFSYAGLNPNDPTVFKPTVKPSASKIRGKLFGGKAELMINVWDSRQFLSMYFYFEKNSRYAAAFEQTWNEHSKSIERLLSLQGHKLHADCKKDPPHRGFTTFIFKSPDWSENVAEIIPDGENFYTLLFLAPNRSGKYDCTSKAAIDWLTEFKICFKKAADVLNT